MTDWRTTYADLAAQVSAAAPTARPLFAGFHTCVDHVHHLRADSLAALDDAAAGDDDALCTLASEVMHRITTGGDGEVFLPVPRLAPVLAALLGTPGRRQAGGTAAQAAWSLAVLGAPAVVALGDRSAGQLRVLHPGIRLATAAGLHPVGVTTPDDGPTRPSRLILEYTAGTRWRGGVIPRSSRIIVRLAADGIDRDEAFAAQPAESAGAGLVSGLNAVGDGDDASRRWLSQLVRGWRSTGVPMIHLELAEYRHADLLADTARGYGGVAHSLGLSLAELAVLHGVADPARAARDVAARYGYDRVCVHADTWSLAVHRELPSATALRTGNLLAAARARRGTPSADLVPDPAAGYTTDLPRAGRLDAGWWVDVAPAPYLARPVATIGLGDTFVAGLLLASCLADALPTG